MNKKQFTKNPNKKGNSKGKRSFRNEDVTSEGRTCGDKLSSLNDISWYKRYPELLEASARIAFPYRPGMKLDMGGVKFPMSSTDIPTASSYEVPGVATMRWIPSFGRSSKATDPTSIAAREIYSKVRSKYSGSLDADAPDFLMYMGALDSIFSYIGALKRIYRILDIYTPQNYVLPDGLLNMMGLTDKTINELRNDKANFNLAINQLIRMTKKFAMPASMDMFVRHYWMNDNVYTDRADINSQFYVFLQVGFYKYAAINTPAGVPAAGLTMMTAPWGNIVPLDITSPTTVLFTFGENLINALSAWDDCYTISGYLMRAYEGVNQFTVDELPLHDQFSPVFVPEVLSQIENSVGVCASNAMSVENIRGTDVSQDPATNAVIYKPYIKAVSTSEDVNFTDAANWINLHENNPSSDAIVIATRLHPVRVKGKEGFDIYAATEIPLGWEVLISFYKNGVKKSYTWGLPQHFSIYSEIGAWVFNDTKAQDLSAIAAMSAFDYHPLINFVLGFDTDETAHAISYMQGDVANITTVPDDVMFNIHRVCTYSELNAFTE